MTRFIVVPQWQGSASTRAMQLIDGAEQIAGDLPRSACTRVDVPLEAGEALGTATRRLSSLLRTRDRVAEALTAAGDGHPVIIGGDASVALPGIAHAAAGRTPAVVWFDAHSGLHSPDSSPHGALSEMALRMVFDTGDVPAIGLDREHVMLAGVREVEDVDLEPHERPRILGVTDLADPAALATAVADTGAEAVWIHIGLDVLDPSVVAGQSDPVPFGLSLAELTGAIAAVRAATPLAGASLTGFAPASPDAAVEDLGVILRIIGAVA